MGLYINTPTNKYFGADIGIKKLDQILEGFLNFDSGYFVELGANNGVFQSNTLYFEKYRDWHGVLVEPILNNYFNCKNNRSKNTRFFAMHALHLAMKINLLK